MRDVCSRGHEMSADNISWQLDGKDRPFRRCLKCNSERAKLWRRVNAHRLERKRPGNPGQTLRRF